MPSAECTCAICKKKTTMNNICSHLMTHKKDLLPFLVSSSEVFTTVRKDDQEHYCCFGCKKSYSDRTKMRDHMKHSDGCVQKHLDFLTDIGCVNVQVKETLDLRRELRLAKREIDDLRDSLREARSESGQAGILDSLTLERNILLSCAEMYQSHFMTVLPHIMKPEVWEYCNRFIANLKKLDDEPYPAEIKSTFKKQYLYIASECPVLQFFLLPDYNFFIREKYCLNEQYQTIGQVYFRSLSYKPSTSIYGNHDVLPDIPSPPSVDQALLFQLQKQAK